MTCHVPLRALDGSVRAYALVDDEDAAWINEYRWRLNTGGYAARNLRAGGVCRYLTMHRAVLGLAIGDRTIVDHINRDKLDNRRANLRIASASLNARNRDFHGHKDGTSRHYGVCWDAAKGRWRAQCGSDGRTHYLGLFEDEEDAARAAADFRARLTRGGAPEPRAIGASR